ncbi:MAG: M23 family metallopeptidase [Rhodospirillales bacterium]
MLLRGLLSAAALAAGVAAAAGVVLDLPAAKERAGDIRADGGDTLALAPISLGNPAAASAALKTQTPPGFRGTDAVPDPVPSFRYALRVGPGDTLAGMLIRAGVDRADTHAAIQALSQHFDPRRIRRGQRIAVILQPAAADAPAAQGARPGRFLGLVVEPDYDVAIRVERTDKGGFAARKIEKALSREWVRAEGRIASSLYVAGREAGLPHRVLAELIRAYSWDVDFQRDVRSGDTFEIMFQRVFDADGREVHAGPIGFAALELSGKRLQIYRHATADGETDYFDDKGQSARKALMRTPIDGARLSSGFGKRRHPILGYTKLHRGVDFAAPPGTPIYAAGDGVVVSRGRNGAYGNYIRIRHNSRYSTAYAHMRAFARKVRKGKRVTQGQVIGFVGTTGRSTGPHLHYEILLAGRRTNPMKVRMPSGRKLKGEELARFEETRTETDRRYAGLTPITKLAAAK